MNTKTKSQKEIIGIVEKLKKQGKKIVAYNGSFDIMHFGHLQCLAEAKKQGDILIVPLNTDNSIKMYKGPDRPIFSQEHRAAFLSALEYVDYVVFFDEINPKKILSEIKPHIYCSGDDWGKWNVSAKLIEENGGEVYVLQSKRPAGASTTELVKKILQVYSKPDIRAVFLDRDGTININEPEYTHKKEDFKVFPETIPALKKLSKTDYKIIVITNQSGIARGYYTEAQMKALHKWMVEDFKKKGIRIDAIYHCPHGPDDDCFCRKPKPGMLLQAGQDFRLNLSKSWFIGDGSADVLAGREANVKTIKIGKKMDEKYKLEPNYYAKNLLEAVNIIIDGKPH